MNIYHLHIPKLLWIQPTGSSKEPLRSIPRKIRQRIKFRPQSPMKHPKSPKRTKKKKVSIVKPNTIKEPKTPKRTPKPPKNQRRVSIVKSKKSNNTKHGNFHFSVKLDNLKIKTITSIHTPN